MTQIEFAKLMREAVDYYSVAVSEIEHAKTNEEKDAALLKMNEANKKLRSVYDVYKDRGIE